MGEVMNSCGFNIAGRRRDSQQLSVMNGRWGCSVQHIQDGVQGYNWLNYWLK